MTEKDKEIQELRREVASLRLELAKAKDIQAILFKLIPDEKLGELLLKAYFEGQAK